MQACMHLHIFQIGNIIMQRHNVFLEWLIRIVRHLVLQISLRRLFQHQLFQITKIFRLRRGKMHVLVHQLFQLLQLVVNSGLSLRRRQMLDKAGGSAAFGLNTLACNRNIIGINIGQIADG